jgi:hypothetical protein
MLNTVKFNDALRTLRKDNTYYRLPKKRVIKSFRQQIALDELLKGKRVQLPIPEVKEPAAAEPAIATAEGRTAVDDEVDRLYVKYMSGDYALTEADIPVRRGLRKYGYKTPIGGILTNASWSNERLARRFIQDESTDVINIMKKRIEELPYGLTFGDFRERQLVKAKISQL